MPVSKARLGGLAAAAALILATPAAAAVIAASTFDDGAEGWLDGDFTVGNSTGPVAYDPAGFITVADAFPYNAFLAPAAFRGDQRAANRGTLSFDLGDDLNDGDVVTALVTFRSAGQLYYGGVVTTPPAASGFTHYEIVISAATFLLGDPGLLTGTQVSEAAFAEALRHVDQLAINADFHSGEDAARLDNVVLTSGAVPEPAAWALAVTGFGVMGAALRRGGRAAA
ncbi:laminin B domain-containing protein [Phenylobacterium sp.]|uniref:laminin B domain-containing protein n=1 Tax=Phenylobacterium sp. TaxID=1871053 RepID=UPI0025EDFD16|nr:laminin B domain-containing protein [Phenylobacterium sp.]